MATSILPGGISHFDQGTQIYHQNVYHDFSQQNTGIHDSHAQYALSNSSNEPMPLSTSSTWPNQISSRRTSSKSPNAPERTPIRHSRINPTRARSTSGSEALYAYATAEQNLQQQQQQQQQQQSLNSASIIQQSTPMSSPPLFSNQAFPSVAPASPFVQQQNYYDHSAAGFTDLPNHHVAHGMTEYYPLARGDLHASPMNPTSLNPQEAMYLQQTGPARAQALPSMSAQPLAFPPMSRPLESTPGNVEVSSSRNKPQCWDHGCNGRQFSTFSNLLRHQREKSGTAAKARCPNCGTEFTRTTARNGHMYGGKCKGMPDASKRSSIAESAEASEE